MRSPADLPDGCASKSSPLPPAAALLSALRFVELPFQPRHQVFSGLQPRLLFAQADLSLSDTLLCGLMFAAAMIRLLLSQRPPTGQFLAGHTGNPGGRPGLPAEVRARPSALSLPDVPVLADALRGDDARVRVVAAAHMLDRLYGRPAQATDLT